MVSNALAPALAAAIVQKSLTFWHTPIPCASPRKAFDAGDKALKLNRPWDSFDITHELIIVAQFTAEGTNELRNRFAAPVLAFVLEIPIRPGKALCCPLLQDFRRYSSKLNVQSKRTKQMIQMTDACGQHVYRERELTSTAMESSGRFSTRVSRSSMYSVPASPISV